MAGKDYRHLAHILDHAEQRNAGALAKPDLLANVGKRHLLRRGDQNAAVDARIAEEVHDGDVLVRSARGRYSRASRELPTVDYEVVQLAPVDFAEELLDESWMWGEQSALPCFFAPRQMTASFGSLRRKPMLITERLSST